MNLRTFEEQYINPKEVNHTQICVDFPPNIHSSGIWSSQQSGTVVSTINSTTVANSTLPILEQQMALAFFTTQILHLLLRSFGIPVFVCQMLAGLLLGPAVLGRFKFYAEVMFSVVNQDILGTLTLFGYSMFLFLIGVKMDISIVVRTGRKALYTGITSLLAPLVLSLITLRFTARYIGHLDYSSYAVLVFASFTNSQTSFPVIVCLLSELKLLTSELGRLGLSSAIVSDLLSLFLRSFSRLAFRSMDHNITRGMTVTHSVALIAYIFAVVFAARPAMYWIVKQTPKGKPVHSGYLFIIIVGALCSGLLSVWFDQFMFFGPFILGLAVPDGPPLGSSLVQKYDFMVSEVLVPLFVTSSVMLMDPFVIKLRSTSSKSYACVLVVSTVSKVVGSLLPAYYCNMPLMDSLILALIMSCKGVVELGAFSMATDGKSWNDEIYSMSVFAILINALIVPLLVRRLYKPSRKYAGYQQRNVVSLKPNAELRILACVHRQDNIASVINLLDACCPTKDNPITLYVLHLIEMFGQAAPIFISHRMQKKTISNCAYSEDVLLSFLQFERDFPGAVSVHPFTAISPTKLMNEDICTLALDRLVSLIILPFHRHWTLDGSIRSEDHTIRSLNISVLERAPCSVGILVNRGPLRQLAQGKNSSASQTLQFKVAVIFLGGEDDREALALTQRMATDPSISLTVFYLTTSRDSDVPNWDRILDMESLRKFRQTYVHDGGYTYYTEEIAENGPQTVAMLRNIVNQYDLFVVGRREHMVSPQTSGLDEWSEFPELGVVGDMLASDDLRCRSSILVVQQQHTTT